MIWSPLHVDVFLIVQYNNFRDLLPFFGGLTSIQINLVTHNPLLIINNIFKIVKTYLGRIKP